MGNESSCEDETSIPEFRRNSETSVVLSPDSHMNPIRVSFDMSALEEGRFPAVKMESYERTVSATPRHWINISELVKRNSFVAVDRDDVYSLALKDETVDHIGDFPYQWDASEIEVFDKLFRFIADHDFQLVTIDKDSESILSIYVIRPIVC